MYKSKQQLTWRGDVRSVNGTTRKVLHFILPRNFISVDGKHTGNRLNDRWCLSFLFSVICTPKLGLMNCRRPITGFPEAWRILRLGGSWAHLRHTTKCLRHALHRGASCRLHCMLEPPAALPQEPNPFTGGVQLADCLKCSAFWHTIAHGRIGNIYLIEKCSSEREWQGPYLNGFATT